MTGGWSTWDTKVIEFFNSGFNGAVSQEFGNFLLILISLLLAALLSGIIGFERETKGHYAGLRTHLLVGVGSAIVMIISMYGFGMWDGEYLTSGVSRDPTRLAAQVVSGIGFLGAGAIIQNGIDVKGLTTAATLWVSMALGLASGSGNFIIATIGGIIAFVSLIVLHKVDKWIAKKNPVVILVLPSDKPSLKEIIMIANRYSISIRDTHTELVSYQDNSAIRVVMRCTFATPATVTSFADELRTALKPLDLKISTGDI